LNVDTGCLIALLTGGLLPALYISSRGDPGARLVGLDLLAAVLTFCLILLSQVGPGQSYDLVLPLVLVPLSFAGTLVFTRLLGKREDHS
jgi:multisubunit Na+/H+ antiporter MnhF subunit